MGAKLILGLGNPGERYRQTRHNVGFRVLEELRGRRRPPEPRLECNSRVWDCESVLLAQPRTFMNRSGYAARCLVERHALTAPDILVVYDEARLSLGRLRLRPKGSPAGHRGLESVLESLESDEIPRLRLGVAGEGVPATGEALTEYVLSPFDESENEAATEMIRRAADACEAWLRSGIEAAMGEYNSPRYQGGAHEASDRVS